MIARQLFLTQVFINTNIHRENKTLSRSTSGRLGRDCAPSAERPRKATVGSHGVATSSSLRCAPRITLVGLLALGLLWRFGGGGGGGEKRNGVKGEVGVC